MSRTKPRINATDFCSQMASSANWLFALNHAAYPFKEVRVESSGSGAGNARRKDLRFLLRNGKLALCGEVKLPGTPGGQSAVNEKIVADAAAKANDARTKYFFTWNVNEFALWDRSTWDRSLFEKRARHWRMPRILTSPDDVACDDNLTFIKTNFLPGLLRDVADIVSGRARHLEP